MDQFEIIEDLQYQTPKKNCSACKKVLSGIHWGILSLSAFILGTSIYGTIKLVQLIISLF